MERVEDGTSMNIVPPMFHAGISNKFTKRHIANFRDTTLTAASAAKQRADRKLERQADAIEKQQQKIDSEMKKIEGITQNLHRQQHREAKRLRNRLNYAATKIQAAYQRHLFRVYQAKRDAAVDIQRTSRGFLARRMCWQLRIQLEEQYQNYLSMIITRSVRKYACRKSRARAIKLRSKAACAIQSIVRIASARSYMQELRHQRQESKLQHRAAIVIQCNARTFMTRLIYLDVLYLICRIQAAMRGCLVRKQLRWIRAADVEAISRLQAHVRGFLVRSGTQAKQNDFRCNSSRSAVSEKYSNPVENTEEARAQIWKRKLGSGWDRNGCIRTGRAASFSVRTDDQVGQDGFKRILGRSTMGLTAHSTPEPVIKRSYWLPPGASFDRRLPVLPVPKRMMALEGADPGDDLRLVTHIRTPKKRPHQKPCPVRLSPVVIPSVHREANELQASSEQEEDILSETEERARRQEELKHKLLLRKNQEKRQLEHDLKLKCEAESETNECKLMEREEKSMRLHLKIIRRRSKEGKIRQVTTDQRREERERLAMAREERHVRLHIKFCARQQIKKRQQLATASTTTSESEALLPSTGATNRREVCRKSSATKSTKAASKDVDSEDDDDMSFLDIDFTIPASMKPRKHSGNNTGSVQSRSSRTPSTRQPTKKKKRSVGRNRDNTSKRIPGRAEVSLSHLGHEDQDDCGYGDEFEEIVDEAALGRLIC